MFGESVVLRVLDRSNVQLSLDRVGLRDDDLEKVRGLISKPNGIMLVTGPTGSGKTTTLYAALTELNTPDRKILTAEDPVEYDIDGLIQCQVNVDQELTFGKLLRSFLRQDPDTILVGEIRDLETAQIAMQASLTGHLVFSTLHTNDAPEFDSSIGRPRHRELPADRDRRGDRRAATGSEDLRQVQGGVRPDRGAADGTVAASRRCRRPDVLPRPRLRQLHEDRLPGPNGDLRDHGHRRHAPRDDHGAGVDRGASR